jgi:hypothetical protein
MSFQIVKVGKSLDVAQEIKELDMQVKAQGHTDPHHVGLNLTIETVY